MHVDFDPVQVDWAAFGITPLDEKLVQYGGYNVFRGVPYQRGSGIGSVFRSFLRYMLPIGKEIGSAIGRQGLESGNRVLTNVLQGKDLKDSLVTEGKAGLKSLLEKAANNLERQEGKGNFDFKKYMTDKKKKPINRLQSSLGPPNFLPVKGRKRNKKVRVDALGSY